ncbi:MULTISPECIES: hypothetical protein [unclassified Pseudomonas]|uniref:hypothetical protein n=1 Tax=unclassified Pseudomonas TaxID=196821 RepID=UPI0016043D36|nr:MULTISPECIES: hypothetical protein [unclassified Pseudomonas]
MHTEDTDTADWLGIPTTEEMLQQHIVLLENELGELNQQLRTARENIHKLVGLYSNAERDREEVLVRFRSKAAEATQHRNRALELETSCGFLRRTNEDLRRQIPEGSKRHLR